MKFPKIALIGAGSMFFGAKTIRSAATKAALCGGTLALVDTYLPRLRCMERIARRAVEFLRVPLKIDATTDRKKALKGADFVILAMSRDSVRLRGIDSRISTRHGMIMSSGDTVGPGGIMRTLREMPLQNQVLKEVRRLCPQAWVINWINPTAAMGIAMTRHFPDVKSMAICDGVHNPHFDDQLMIDAGLARSAAEITPALRRRVSIRSGGVNHFSWLVEMTCDGRDVTHRIKDKLRAAAEERRAAPHDGHGALTPLIAWQLADALGYVPTAVGHTQEYLPFFQGHDVHRKNALTIARWPEPLRRQWVREYWKEMNDYADGKIPIANFLSTVSNDYASDIIESMWLNKPRRFYINTSNNGAVTNLSDDAYVEIPCRPDMDGVNPLPFGRLPPPLLGYVRRVLDEHELAVEAAMTGSRKILRQAFLASMVAVSIPDVDACIAELLDRQRNDLPKIWQRKSI